MKYSRHRLSDFNTCFDSANCFEVASIFSPWAPAGPGWPRAPPAAGAGGTGGGASFPFVPAPELRTGRRWELVAGAAARANPAELVVDVGCGSGQGTRFLAEHFKKVVGTDISEAQIQEARDAPSPPNISYLVCPAEELPFKDASVDLLASFTAAHWFDIEKFMREANRAVKPGGCVVISTYTRDVSLRYGNCSEKLTEVFREAWDLLLKYMHSRVKHVLEDYKEIFEAIPFPDKKRITNIFDKIPMTVAGVIGYLESVSPYQAFMKSDPKAAKSFLPETEKRMLDSMEVSSRETPVEFWVRHVCMLACKGQ